MAKKKRWSRLKRFIQKLKQVDATGGRGDGGLMTDDFLNRGESHSDSIRVVQDSIVVKPNRPL